MYTNLTYTDINHALPDLADFVLGGAETGSRNGLSKERTFVGVTLTHPLNRAIIVPGRRANLAAQIAETMWVLSGRDDVAWLSHYLPRAADFSDDKAIWRGGYGKRLRAWPRRDGDPFDQISWVVDLLKADPETRRAVVNIYDPDVDSAPGLDIPCNDWLHFLSRNGSLDLHVAVRSNDLMWGWSGINQFEWSSLLDLVAALTGLKVGMLHFSISSLHLYEPHWAKARTFREVPRLGLIEAWGENQENPEWHPRFKVSSVDRFDRLAVRWFALEERIRNGEPCEEMVDVFPEPLMRSWLRVLQWWWTGDDTYFAPLGSNLFEAAKVALQPPPRTNKFVDFVVHLHAEKHEAYGNSWKRRGEMLGIMANIARKIDRLGVAGAGDTAADTAIDLLVYLVKYRLWLVDYGGFAAPMPEMNDGPLSDTEQPVSQFLRHIPSRLAPDLDSDAERIEYLIDMFSNLERAVTSDPENRCHVVWEMIVRAWPLAVSLWEAEQGA